MTTTFDMSALLSAELPTPTVHVAFVGLLALGFSSQTGSMSDGRLFLVNNIPSWVRTGECFSGLLERRT